MAERFFYLDYNATTPTDPEVAKEMQPYLTGFFGNPSSTHQAGRQARNAVERARSDVATCIGAEPEEIVFTSGGTESNNLALRGVVGAMGGGHVVASSVEHPAILEVVRNLERRGLISLTVVEVDGVGRVDPESVAGAMRPDTVLVTVMLANNEVGTIQPIREIAELCKDRGVLMHTDAAQAIGKMEVDVNQLGVDLLSVAGHKLYAPKGVGALFVRKKTPIQPIIHGAGHERGLRPGTENVLEQVGLGAACALVSRDVRREVVRLRELRNSLRGLFEAEIPDLVVHGCPENSLPNTLSVAFPGIDANRVLDRLGNEVAASAGAACHSEDAVVSHVLAAMSVDAGLAMSTIRFSVGRFTEKSEVMEAADRILHEIAVVTDADRQGGE